MVSGETGENEAGSRRNRGRRFVAMPAETGQFTCVRALQL